MIFLTPAKPSNHSPSKSQNRRNSLPVMHTSRVSSPRYSASRVFFCLETASLYSSPTRLTRLLPQLIFHCATVFYAPRRHSRLLARRPHSPTTLDSPRARLAASCASLLPAPVELDIFDIPLTDDCSQGHSALGKRAISPQLIDN
jgi:hypothetical protein